MTAAQADLARRLVAARGRDATFLKYDRAAADPNKPWRGALDPRAVPDATASVPSVFVPPTGTATLGFAAVSEELLKRVTQICIAAPGSAVTDNLEEFDGVLDPVDNTRYKIEFVRVLRPADVRIVYFVGLSQ